MSTGFHNLPELEIQVMSYNGKPQSIRIDADTLTTMAQQVGSMHGQMQDVVKRLEAVESWQKRYGGHWGVFCIGFIGGVYMLGSLALKLWPLISKLFR